MKTLATVLAVVALASSAAAQSASAAPAAKPQAGIPHVVVTAKRMSDEEKARFDEEARLANAAKARANTVVIARQAS